MARCNPVDRSPKFLPTQRLLEDEIQGAPHPWPGMAARSLRGRYADRNPVCSFSAALASSSDS